jgi:hypothetical protein
MKARKYLKSIGSYFYVRNEQEALNCLINSHVTQRKTIQYDQKLKLYCFNNWFLKKILFYVMKKVNES